MKISGFNPIILTNDLEKLCSVHVEKLGFKVIHTIKGTAADPEAVGEYVMENDAGARIDLVYYEKAVNGITSVRVNVDDFDEALAVYQSEGFSVAAGPVVLKSAKWALVDRGSDGNTFVLMQHIK